MAAATRPLVTIALGGFVVLGTPVLALAQGGARSAVPPIARLASFAPGTVEGIVRDEQGTPVAGVVISALGATTTIAVTNQDGRFTFDTLSPGPYLLRAHLPGYVAPRGRMIQVSPSGHAAADIALRRVGSAAPVLAAGFAGQPAAIEAPVESASTEAPSPAAAEAPREIVWRLRHARRGLLKEVSLADAVLAEAAPPELWLGPLTAFDAVGRAVRSQARAATSFFADTPFSGQVNLLTTGSFDMSDQLSSNDSLSRNIAYVHVGAPVGERGDWNVRGALTQADISSWIVAGSYTGRSGTERRYDVGLSYATQRYDGANLLTLRDVTDGSRNAGTVYGYDSRMLSSSATLTYGASYARYDYLNDKSLISPRVELTLAPTDGFRLSAAAASRALAPGAEEFLPPADSSIWLPPQRTFSSIERSQPFQAERTLHAEVAVERDLGPSTVAVRAFRQRVEDQLVTLFGADMPGQPAAKRGHYLVGNMGDAFVAGCSAALRGVIAGRVHGSVEYTFANAELAPTGDVRALMLLAPSAVRSGRDRIHDVSTTIETEVPETATRVLVFYRVSNGFARTATGDDEPARPALDGRFDVQVRQSLPFMNFTSARWEMLLAVRNFFREAGTEQSFYDELLVVRPPKRVVGGVALRF